MCFAAELHFNRLTYIFAIKALYLSLYYDTSQMGELLSLGGRKYNEGGDICTGGESVSLVLSRVLKNSDSQIRAVYSTASSTYKMNDGNP